MTALNSGSNDWEPALHLDGDLLVFNRAVGGNFVATRNGTQFDDAMTLVGWNPDDFGPAWLPTGDRMYLTGCRSISKASIPPACTSTSPRAAPWRSRSERRC